MRNKKSKLFLRAMWASKGLTRAQVAKKLGLHESSVRSFENGNREVTAEMAVRIEKLIGIPREVIRPDIFR